MSCLSCVYAMKFFKLFLWHEGGMSLVQLVFVGSKLFNINWALEAFHLTKHAEELIRWRT